MTWEKLVSIPHVMTRALVMTHDIMVFTIFHPKAKPFTLVCQINIALRLLIFRIFLIATHLFGILRLLIFGIFKNLKVFLPTSFIKKYYFYYWFSSYMDQIFQINYHCYVYLVWYVYQFFRIFPLLRLFGCYVYLADKSTYLNYGTWRWIRFRVLVWCRHPL